MAYFAQSATMLRISAGTGFIADLRKEGLEPDRFILPALQMIERRQHSSMAHLNPVA